MGILDWLAQTMLVERLIGILSYLGIVIYVFKTIKYKNNKKIKKSFNKALIVLTIISFFYIPGNDADLVRIREMISGWGSLSVKDFFDEILLRSSVPCAYLLYYLIAKIGVQGLLPAFCALIFYGNSFHIFKILINEDIYSHKAIAYSFLAFMSSGALLEVISDVRCFVAFSIVMRFIFDEIFQGKTIFKHLIFFVVAALVHPAAIVAILIWYVYYLVISKKNGWIKTLCNVFTVVFFMGIAIYFGSSYITEMYNKASAFIKGSNTYSYFWEYIIGILQVILFIYILNNRRHIVNIKVDQKIKELSKLAWIFLIIVITLFSEYNIFHRFITASSFLMIPVMAEALSVCEKERIHGVKYKVVQILSYIILIIACTRGTLCGFKYFLI